MKLLNFNNVLCLSPHPDDVEYSMSGTILKHRDTLFHIICISNGGNDRIEQIRYNEVDKFWNGVQNVRLHFLKNRNITEESLTRLIYVIENEFNFLQTDCIFTPSNNDSHQEHRILSGIGHSLIRSKLISLIEYKSPSTLDSWTPSMFIDIQEQYPNKLKRLNSFESQSHANYFNVDVLNGFHTHFQYLKKGKKCMVEQFNIKELHEGIIV